MSYTWTKIWENKTWSIELRGDNKEFCFSNGYNCYYAYYHKEKDCLVWDIVGAPQYIRVKGLSIARKQVISIYE